jgi:hypothetical protein
MAGFTKAKALPTNVGRLPSLFGWLESLISVQLPKIKLESFLESELGFKLTSVL